MNKSKIIIGILSILLIIVSYIAFSPKKIIDNTFADKHIHDLDSANNRLLKDDALEVKKSVNFERIIDSLKSLKPQIKIQYENKTKEINSASTNDVVNDFKNIFAENHITK